jgi:hypothetical protein
MIGTTSDGTTLTLFNEFNVHSFKDRIIYPLAPRQMANLIKQQCEKNAGTHSRIAALGDNGLLLSVIALLSFCYLFGWKLGLMLAAVIVLHEMGHVAAMLMAGVGVRSIYLIPFFGGAAVPKTAYRTEARLGFIALMGPGLSLIPTVGLFVLYRATGNIQFREAAEMFAVVNAANLLPLYPLDGGLILNPDRFGEPAIRLDRRLDRGAGRTGSRHLFSLVPDRHSVFPVCAAALSQRQPNHRTRTAVVWWWGRLGPRLNRNFRSVCLVIMALHARI